MTPDRLFLWVAFNVFVLGMLAVDLRVFHRKAHAVSLREALAWSIVWISLALIFNLGIYYVWGEEKALEFLTGYLIEKSLSVDNLFVFLVIFSYFAVPAMYQHRVLFWGILGALVMRAIFIATGAALLTAFHWMIYVFGGFLIITGIKLLLTGHHKVEPEKNPAVRLLRRVMHVTKEYHGQRFFVRSNGRLWATPLLLVLVVVETTDVIFAVDSIPAIFAITMDPFIVYTSNVFAILGLRALYFLLAGIMDMFRYLKVGLSFVLCFVGVKMMIVDLYKIPIGVSLGVVAGILALSIFASLIAQRKTLAIPASGLDPGLGLRDGLGMSLNRGPSRRQNKVWIWFAVIIAVLVIVKLTSISTGPSADDAIVAIRVAQRDLAQAKYIHRGAKSPTLNDAEAQLSLASSALEEKRYEEAILAARKAIELARKLMG